jgi:hypothetical protein
VLLVLFGQLGKKRFMTLSQSIGVKNCSHASWHLAPGMLSGLLLASLLAHVG